ncbi:manganese ABC transporter ATP-binding protein [Corynebacterium yudongzhengii]|uniref:Metal ABC transporter ATP-binding protein n=1 Tax=Corynebacterium yudongzhengii TaxID=2080740 RepID=A0A2U1T704_9CORY|nr:metal ABC transporter ATP-binding protein [Corynebacterium yudongzhengii]AWB81329.1 manganese ABC transporter ATP-binding protein [Corynebacterium yudongzhengii]PWC01772.1 metal ABC transporter ATP-binding protein [Corynebacterium yudongzhengii]
MSVALAVTDLSVTYGTTRALKEISCTVPEGSITGLIGPNGSGKSTFAKAILGLTPHSGTVSFFDQPQREVLASGGLVGYMPQSSAVDLDFPVTVADVVLMGTYGRLGWFRRPGRRERREAIKAMEMTGVEDLAHRQIGQLSGGQRQRVFLARALVQEPRMLVLDEPFAGIDLASEAAIIDVLRQLRDTTILIVHHDLGTVRELCDYAVVLKQGELVAAGRNVLDQSTLAYAYDLPEFS